MARPGIDEHRQALSTFARKLTRGCALPVDVVEICHRLGVTLQRDEGFNYRQAQLFDTGIETVVKLPSRHTGQSTYTPHDRFLIGHEIAHLYLRRERHASILRDGDYWRQEELCDYFARVLLLPDEAVASPCASSPSNPESLLEVIERLTMRASVTWATAAHRLADFRAQAEFLLIVRKRESGRTRFRVHATTLPCRKQIHRKLDAASGLARLLSRLKRNQPAVRIDNALLQQAGLSSFRDGETSAVVKIGSREYGIAITRGASDFAANSRVRPPR